MVGGALYQAGQLGYFGGQSDIRAEGQGPTTAGLLTGLLTVAHLQETRPRVNVATPLTD